MHQHPCPTLCPSPLPCSPTRASIQTTSSAQCTKDECGCRRMRYLPLSSKKLPFLRVQRRLPGYLESGLGHHLLVLEPLDRDQRGVLILIAHAAQEPQDCPLDIKPVQRRRRVRVNHCVQNPGLGFPLRSMPPSCLQRVKGFRGLTARGAKGRPGSKASAHLAFRVLRIPSPVVHLASGHYPTLLLPTPLPPPPPFLYFSAQNPRPRPSNAS
jgi:hypothetical protein